MVASLTLLKSILHRLSTIPATFPILAGIGDGKQSALFSFLKGWGQKVHHKADFAQACHHCAGLKTTRSTGMHPHSRASQPNLPSSTDQRTLCLPWHLKRKRNTWHRNRGSGALKCCWRLRRPLSSSLLTCKRCMKNIRVSRRIFRL